MIHIKNFLVIILGICVFFGLMATDIQAEADIDNAAMQSRRKISDSYSIEGRYEGNEIKIGQGGGKYMVALILTGNTIINIQLFLETDGELPITPTYSQLGVFKLPIGSSMGSDDQGKTTFYFLVLENKILFLRQKSFIDTSEKDYLTIGILDKIEDDE